MAPIYSFIVVGYTLLLLGLTLAKVKILKLLGISLIIAQAFCLVHISMNEAPQVLWLCNVVVFMQVFLIFKFNQKVFDMVYYFAWTGCFIICFMPNNPYAMMLKTMPLFWITYWIKHLIPLIIPIYFMHVQKRRLSEWSIYTGALYFLIYCALIVLFNLTFNQNIFYLMKPAPFMKSLGPFYFLIAIIFGYVWFATLYVIAGNLGWVKTKKETVVEKEVELGTESSEI